MTITTVGNVILHIYHSDYISLATMVLGFLIAYLLKALFKIKLHHIQDNLITLILASYLCWMTLKLLNVDSLLAGCLNYIAVYTYFGLFLFNDYDFIGFNFNDNGLISCNVSDDIYLCLLIFFNK